MEKIFLISAISVLCLSASGQPVKEINIQDDRP